MPTQITDSDALAFLISERAHVEARIWERKYTPIIYQELMPVSGEASEWAKSIEVHFIDGFTEGKFIGAGGDDMPYARINKGRDTVPVEYGGIGYEYTLEELREAAAGRVPLDVTSANMARRGYEEHAQRIGLLGDADRGLEGLLNHSAIPTAAAATTLAVALASGTPGDSAAALINEPLNAVIEDSKGIEMPNRLLMSIADMNTLATTRLGTVNDTTILDYVKTKNAYTAMTGRPLEIRGIPQITDELLAYSSSEDVMVYHIPLVLRFIAPQPVGLKVRVPGEYKLAGLEMRYPGACARRTGF